MHSTLLAFDIGTSGLKASLVDENLNIIRNVTTTYPTHHYPDGGCEQEAADWWMSAVRAMMMLRELAPEYVKRVDAIGVSGHMLGCLPMDSEGQTLRPAMIHADTRALAISNALRARYGRDYFYEICGNVLSPASTLCKTLWLKEHEPELYARTVRILQSKDYLVYRLTGHMDTTDMSDASHGLLMNLRTRQYDLDMFRNVGVDVEKFPEIRTSCELAGYLSEEAAGCLGLRRSEICGLKWRNVDLKRGVLKICEVRTAVSGRALEKAPKSYASERRLAFGGNEDLESLLKRLHRDWERRRKQDPKYNPEGYVAVNEAGKPYQPDVLCQRIAQFIAAQGLPPISLHGLRHSFASVANSQNVPMFSISKALGHSSTSVTSAVYMHLFDDAVADVVSQVASAITGKEQ